MLGLIASLVGGGVQGAASVLGAKSSKKAANKAADIALQTATMNNTLARDIYGQNRDMLSPYSDRGNTAGTAINALLGLGGPAPQAQQPMAQPQMNMLGSPVGDGGGRRFQLDGGYSENALAPSQYGQPEPVQPAAPAASGPSPYETAFGNFLNSTGFRFQMDEGNRAINTGYAAHGTLQSGAAQKALQDRGQQTALNNYFLPYMGLLQGQQGAGLGAASAVAGVGQNYVNNVSANNNSAGSAAANAALMKGAITNNMFGGIAQNIGNLFGSSYRI